MNAFYEELRENDRELRIIRNGNHSYRPHFHINVELLIVKRGDYLAEVNGSQYRVGDGTVLLCDSYDIHSYERLSDGGADDDCVLIIPERYLSRFSAYQRGRRPSTPLFRDGALCELLLALVDTVLLAAENEYLVASTLDYMLARLLEGTALVEVEEGRDVGLIRRILSYINRHYREPITMASVATGLGYSAAHLSRVFHHFMKTNVKAYINRLRLSYIKQRLSEDPKADITPLIFEAGFGSIQSYYRSQNGLEPISPRR